MGHGGGHFTKPLAACRMEQRNYLKSGGWWPLISAAQIEQRPPEIVSDLPEY
jgi:hypothetical protein